jgi:hypothetical protein
LYLTREFRDLIWGKSLCRPEQGCELDWMALYDISQVRRYAARSRHQIVSIATNDFGNRPHLFLNRRAELFALNL